MTRRGFVRIGILVVILVAVVAAAAVLTQLRRKQEEIVPPSVPANPAAPADISSWQTYRSQEYGFEVRYP